MKLSKGLLQSYQLQDFTFQAAMALKEALTKDGKLAVTREDAQAVKALVSSWRDCQERVSFHRRVPPVKAVEPPAPKRKRRGAVGISPYLTAPLPVELIQTDTTSAPSANGFSLHGQANVTGA
jgi:hypothetical protein